jgi:hypothetical protein
MHHGYRKFGPGRGRLHFNRPFPNRLELLARLESYQRDLEQELADLDDLIRHLRGNGEPAGPASAEPQPAG